MKTEYREFFILILLEENGAEYHISLENTGGYSLYGPPPGTSLGQEP